MGETMCDAGHLPADASEADIRSEVRRVMESEKISQREMARVLQVAEGSFSAWMIDKYAGRSDKIAAQVAMGLRARRERKTLGAVLPKAPSFVLTKSAETFQNMMSFAQVAPTMVLIAGGAGVGKTFAALDYAANHPNVWVMTAEACIRSPYAMLEELALVLGIPQCAAGLRSRAIQEKMRGSQGLLVIDDAQHLSVAAMDQLRGLHDKTGIGIAVIGNEGIYATLDGVGRKKEFAQIFSRIGGRVSRPAPLLEDINALVDVWGNIGPAQRKFLHVLARKPGGLRGMTMTLRMAHMQALGPDSDIDTATLQSAWENLGGESMRAAA